MIDAQIKNATCKVKCGEETGTGWLVTPSIVITARHCVYEAIDDGAQIDLRFSIDGADKDSTASVLADNTDFDVCVLQLPEDIDITPIVLSEALPVEGRRFVSYGFPETKLTVSHRLEGTVSQVLDELKLKMDVDLHVDSPAALSEYKGISGAALICGGVCQGLLRIKLDLSLGAVSVCRMAAFLRENAIPIEEGAKEELCDREELVSRKSFIESFDSLVLSVTNGYAFIEGAHGIGKSTFCDSYLPLSPELDYFATYSFSSRKNRVNGMHLAQPEVFFDWLNTQVSSLLTGKAARISIKSYSELIKDTTKLLESLGGMYSSQGKTGVIFVDGLDEVAKLGEDVFLKFIGLFPTEIPTGLVLVMSGPSYTKLSSLIGGRVGSQACITMPSLMRSDVRDYCARALLSNRYSPETISIICDRAQGHPLYLRYLIDLVNEGTEDEHLDTLPLINGSIRNYYECLWSQLSVDPEVVNLLAIIARLRWGITIQQFSEILTDSERVTLVSTIERIQHLLLESNETTIYHSSFVDYLIEKTELRDPDIQQRLAQYCHNNPGSRYGKLNIIYHGLKSLEEQEVLVVSACNQEWADQCVTLGVEPDVLLGDVEGALNSAAHRGKLIDVVRLLLLAQRLQFRYDSLFALSADLVADALLALGKTQETIQHVVRYGRLIVPVHEALRIAYQLIVDKKLDEALKLLDKTEVVLEKRLSDRNPKVEDFMELFEFQIQQKILRYRAGDENAMDMLMRFHHVSMQAVTNSIQKQSDLRHILPEMNSWVLGSSICLGNRYTPLAVLRKMNPNPIPRQEIVLMRALANYQEYCFDFGLTPDQNILKQVFCDLRTLLDEAEGEPYKPQLDTVNSIISLGAPVDLVALITDKMDCQMEPVKFISADNVGMDERELHAGMSPWRLMSMLNENIPCPETEELLHENWQNGVDLICRALAWCDGAARRAKNKGNDAGLQQVWVLLESRVFNRLRITLAQRVEWSDSYSLPESVFPHIYGYLNCLITDVFPEKIGYMLEFLNERFPFQYGLYSEGFCAILITVLDRVCKHQPLDDKVEDLAWNLLLRWQEFVLKNVKNRHELIPELLALIPLFVHLGASEEAERTYQSVLALSMGPDWYKEDQLSLMTGAIDQIPEGEAFEVGVLPRIASLLEAASGEMTFQRYVRYDKAELLEILCKRGDYSKAVSYFLRQICGTAEQMLTEISEGEIDRISPLRGMRFPGGALDEQEAIHRILRHAIPSGHWALCWALLEIYQFGDRRHLSATAELYAQIIEKIDGDKVALKEITRRLRLAIETELASHQRSEFVIYLREKLPTDKLEMFKGILDEHSVSGQSQKEVLTGYVEGKSEAKNEVTRDGMVLPGVFGTQHSIQQSEAAVLRAERLLSRRNNTAAQKEASIALEHLQRGGWSIWGNLSSGATRAKNILLHKSDSADTVVKLYAPLVLNERYAERWRRADHLIGQLAGITTREERAALIQTAIEHIETIVGCDEKSQEYEFLEDSYQGSVSESLIQLLVYALNHPQWLRREKSAEMLLWLLESHPEYIPTVGPKAFAMDSTNSPDIICGVLDHLSQSHPIKLWNQLAPALNFEEVLHSCKHIGRFTVLLRIVERAVRQNGAGAVEIRDQLRRKISSPTEVVDPAMTKAGCPEWALIAEYQWGKLDAMGLATKELVEHTKKVLEDECAPLEIDIYIEVERLLAEGFRDNMEHPLGRWMAKISYALQVALFPIVSEEFFLRIEQIFRPYNPVRVDRFRISNFSSPSVAWVEALKNQNGKIIPIRGNDIYLDFLERVWIEGQWRLFRLTAFFYDHKVHATKLPQFASFSPTEQASLDGASWCDCCVGVDGTGSFFGSFTPALPSDTLMKLTRATSADINRTYWRSGRHPLSQGGGPEHEGCYLSIKANALKLIQGLQVAWVLQIDGRPLGIVEAP